MRAWSAVGLRRVACAVVCILAGCQPPPRPVAVVSEPRAVNGIGYVVLTAQISPAARDLFVAEVEKLRNTGATEIHLALNTSGGDIDAAQAIADYMARLHSQNGVVLKTYNTGVVGSPATFVFLNAQDRYSVPTGAFSFHTTQVTTAGVASSSSLHDAVDKLDAFERRMRTALTARSRLTASEAEIYVRRNVVLNSDDARRDGLVDAIAPFTAPAGTTSWTISPKLPAGPPARPATPAASSSNG